MRCRIDSFPGSLWVVGCLMALALFFGCLWQSEAQDERGSGLDQVRSDYEAKVAAEEKSYEDQYAALNTQYVRAVERELQKAVQDGNLDVAAAMKQEKEAVLGGEEHPVAGEGSKLAGLQEVYRVNVAKLKTQRDEAVKAMTLPLIGKLQAYETQLTKSAKIDEALAAREWREELEALPGLSGPGESRGSGQVVEALRFSSREKPYENRLGMKFVPVSIEHDGEPRTVWFCIWETRIRDFEKFVDGGGLAGEAWKGVTVKGEEQGQDHPVLNVSWEEAVAFCDWLSTEDGSGIRYRLPTDQEWSCAVGIGDQQDPELSPHLKMLQTPSPWTNTEVAANFSEKMNRDKFAFTAPVGSFPANEVGLFDMAGNVWEWCEDWHNRETKPHRVMRGCSYTNWGDGFVRPSQRVQLPAPWSENSIGFRVVFNPDGT